MYNGTSNPPLNTCSAKQSLVTSLWRDKNLIGWRRIQYSAGLYTIYKERNQFAFCSAAIFSRAWASWSGHDVDLNPHRIPLSRLMASATLMPWTRTEIPCVLPLHPPSYFTSEIMSSSKVMWMAEEQTPLVRYTNDLVIILYRTPDKTGASFLHLRQLFPRRRRAEKYMSYYTWESCAQHTAQIHDKLAIIRWCEFMLWILLYHNWHILYRFLKSFSKKVTISICVKCIKKQAKIWKISILIARLKIKKSE